LYLKRFVEDGRVLKYSVSKDILKTRDIDRKLICESWYESSRMVAS
jgi:hypothetical protein